jgi:hypothetical protein
MHGPINIKNFTFTYEVLYLEKKKMEVLLMLPTILISLALEGISRIQVFPTVILISVWTQVSCTVGI